MDLTSFSESVGAQDEVTITGLGSRGGPVHGVRRVHAPAGIEWLEADEMTVRCGAGTTTDELAMALTDVGQYVALPPGGTVGGALAVGAAGIRRLGDGPVRDTLLQARYVSATGEVVTAGGPTVKNVSGFDLCRVLVGSKGTLGFLGDVILRTRPLPPTSRWFTYHTEHPMELLSTLYRPTSMLWNGAAVWILLEGHPDDIDESAARHRLVAADGPPDLPPTRSVVAPSQLGDLRGDFVAELGVGVVHGECTAAVRTRDPNVDVVHRRLKAHFDPSGRLNPGVRV
jgi:hypothetical protein